MNGRLLYAEIGTLKNKEGVREMVKVLSLFLILSLVSVLGVGDLVAAEELELKYDDGEADAQISVGPLLGFAVYFSPPTVPFVIKEVKIFASLRGEKYEDQITLFEIRDKDFDLIYSWKKPATEFSLNPSWVKMEINVRVKGDFYVVFYPRSRREGGVYLFFDLSKNKGSKAVKVIDKGANLTNEWPFPFPFEQTNWMIRVVGEGDR